jgi:type I restriction enzyme S subunit
MNLTNTRYVELTFINDLEEIKKQIRNTVLFLYLAEKYKLCFLSDYLEDTQYGYTASSKSEGKIKLLRITDITEGKVDWESVPYCDCDNPTKYLLHTNDILVARTGGTTGKSFIVKDVPSNVVYASYLIRLRVAESNNPEFISAYLNSYTYWSQLVELKRGAAQPNVNAEKLKTIVIPKCSIEVQNKYLSILKGELKDDILENRIKNITTLFDDSQLLQAEQSNQLNLLKTLRQQILQDAVQGKLVPQDPNDEPARKLLERIKAEKEQLIRDKKIKQDKPLPEIKPEEIPFEIPETWVWCRLGDIVLSMTNGIYKEDKYYNESGIGCLRMYNIKDGQINFNNLKHMILTDKELSTYSLEENDLLLNRVNSIELLGKAGLIKKLDKKLVFESKNIRVRLFNKESLGAYVNYIFQLPFIKNQIYHSFKKVTGQASISQEKLTPLLIPLAPLAEQNRIHIKIEQFTKLFDEMEQSIHQNQNYTQQLLQVALKEALEPQEK